MTRLGKFVTGLFYASFACTAIAIIFGMDSKTSGDQQARDWTATVLSKPLGMFIVALIGAGIIIFGMSQFYRALSAKLGDRLQAWRMNDHAYRWSLRCGRVGTAARGVVFCVIGIFIVVAALHTNPREAIGLGGALAKLERAPYGPWLLGAVGAGLVAYGLFQFVQSRYCRIARA